MFHEIQSQDQGIFGNAKNQELHSDFLRIIKIKK